MYARLKRRVHVLVVFGLGKSIVGDEHCPFPAGGDAVTEPAIDLVGIEARIDAIDWLRREMRRLGMSDCADALDQSFVRSLQAYVILRNRQEGGAIDTPTH